MSLSMSIGNRTPVAGMMEITRMAKEKKTRFREIRTYPEKCSGCISCQLACSFAHAKRFSPAQSRIEINYPGDIDRTISFSEECIRCGICVDVCNYGALEAVAWESGEAA